MLFIAFQYIHFMIINVKKTSLNLHSATGRGIFTRTISETVGNSVPILCQNLYNSSQQLKQF